MTLMIQDAHQGLRVDETGTVRIGKTRVTLDVLIGAHRRGDRPEDIVRDYDTLDLADVYAAIAYYLSHRDEVDAYLHAREEYGERLRKEIEASQPDRATWKAQLLARKEAKEQAHAAPGQ